jgi:hypothetical protein
MSDLLMPHGAPSELVAGYLPCCFCFFGRNGVVVKRPRTIPLNDHCLFLVTNEEALLCGVVALCLLCAAPFCLLVLRLL